ncbi:AAA family ATPase [Leptolyngbya sp. NK1-12]|uniref:AAA family ATPase n=1 Tax=Leptolyngbya sp. NK1-12 TaxID=2547451 RepID=A0AA96WN35_9CYAN|nr:AAA family ATPase [Leptolyngbya sp. NK1-12]
MDESDKLAEKIGIVVQGGQVTIHTVNLGQAEATPLPEPKPAELPDCPYRGLFAFHEEHVEFFFGRDVFTQGLVQAVQTKSLVAVVGASGSGKSSLVFAGLLPNLLEQGGWCIFKLRPGFPDSRPFHNLTSALLPLSAVPNLDPLILLNQRAKDLQEGTLSLRDVVAEILRQAPKGTERVLLVVDQFEELYTLSNQDDRERFVDLLLAGVKDAPCKVVLTLRADFCGQAYAYRPLVDALQDADLKLGSMNQAELQAAIEKPAEKMGVKLEAGLTERILEDVGKEPGNLPLLEFALTRLWDKQQNRELTHESYSEIGGVKQALADHAEAIYSKLTEPEQKQAQQIFVQLVQLGEGTADTRRLVTRAEISDDCWQLITGKGGLADCRLVVTGRNDQTNEETVEVVHEALIREWRTLRQWIDTDRKELLQKNEIEAQAKRWAEKKSKDYLLQGKRLQEARVFQKEQADHLKLSNQAQEFIQKSRRNTRTNQLKLASLLLIPIMIVYAAVVPQLRQQKYIRAWETVKAKDAGTREALEILTEGCQEKEIILGTVLFGDCADLSSTDLSGTDLFDADLSYVNFDSTDLSRADLKFADLSGAYLLGADLKFADLLGADLYGTTLSGATLSCLIQQCTDFRGAEGLTPEQVKSAKNWEQAVYDSAFCQQVGLKDCKTKQVVEK